MAIRAQANTLERQESRPMCCPEFRPHFFNFATYLFVFIARRTRNLLCNDHNSVLNRRQLLVPDLGSME